MSDRLFVIAFCVCVGLLLCSVPSCMYIVPQYTVWQRKMAGEADFAHAEFSKRVSVETARAKKDAAVLEAEAEVTRAEGAAKAAEIIKASLSGETGELYLRYLWINGIDHESAKTIIYIPTEANLPLLESGRLIAQ